jgi:hypothetical protein
MRMFRIRRELRRSLVAESETDAEAEARIIELAVTVQSALRVGAAVEAREAGRRAFAELMKFLAHHSKPEGPSTRAPKKAKVASVDATARVSGLRTALRRRRKSKSTTVEQEDRTGSPKSR